MTAPVLEISGVEFRRGGQQILADIDLTVRAGEHWALLGPNGAGKTTLMRLCGALEHPTSGTVHVLGSQVGRVELQRLRQNIGHVDPRHPLRSPLTIRQVVLTGLRGSIDLPPRWTPTTEQITDADRLVRGLGLGAKADSVWQELSQGERGRALIARALITEPRLLLLDEPSTGLDLAAREQLLETLDLLEQTHPGLASILVTHHLEELPTITSHAALVSHGRIATLGPASEVITTDAVSSAFEHPIEVGYSRGRWSARADARARQ